MPRMEGQTRAKGWILTLALIQKPGPLSKAKRGEPRLSLIRIPFISGAPFALQMVGGPVPRICVRYALLRHTRSDVFSEVFINSSPRF